MEMWSSAGLCLSISSFMQCPCCAGVAKGRCEGRRVVSSFRHVSCFLSLPPSLPRLLYMWMSHSKWGVISLPLFLARFLYGAPWQDWRSDAGMGKQVCGLAPWGLSPPSSPFLFLPPPSLPSGWLIRVTWKTFLSSGGGNSDDKVGDVAAAGPSPGNREFSDSSDTVVQREWRLQGMRLRVFTEHLCACVSLKPWINVTFFSCSNVTACQTKKKLPSSFIQTNVSSQNTLTSDCLLHPWVSYSGSTTLCIWWRLTKTEFTMALHASTLTCCSPQWFREERWNALWRKTSA